jgi:hypothetical protein
MDKPSDILKAGKALISNPAKWTQHTEARAANLVPVGVFDHNACSFCSYGALMRVAGERRYHAYHYHPALDQMEDRHLMTITVNYLIDGFGGSIGGSNDSLTHPEVLQLWDTAIHLAEQRERLLR